MPINGHQTLSLILVELCMNHVINSRLGSSTSVTCTYIEEEAQHGCSVGMIECLTNCRILLVAMHNVHLHGIAYIVDDMLRATIVLVAPVEVKSLHLKLTGQLGATYIRQELFLLLARISLGYANGDCNESV